MQAFFCLGDCSQLLPWPDPDRWNSTVWLRVLCSPNAAPISSAIRLVLSGLYLTSVAVIIAQTRALAGLIELSLLTHFKGTMWTTTYL